MSTKGTFASASSDILENRNPFKNKYNNRFQWDVQQLILANF